MPFLGTLENIDIALANLDLKEGTLKTQFVEAVRAHFPDQESLETIQAIPVEDLIRKVWQTDDPEEIQTKRKNLSGLKSSVNKSLKELIAEGKNPDGIIIGRDNTFTIAEEQKDQLIKQLGITPESIHSLRDMLTTFKKFLVNMPQGEGIGDVQNLLEELEDTRKLMQTLAAPTREVPPDSGLSAAELIDAAPAPAEQRETETDEEAPSLEEVEVVELPAEADLLPEGQMAAHEGLEEIDEEELLEIEADGLDDLLAEQLATLAAAEEAEEAQAVELAEESIPEAGELAELPEGELIEIEADELAEVAAEELAAAPPGEEEEEPEEAQAVELAEESIPKAGELAELPEGELIEVEADELAEVAAEELAAGLGDNGAAAPGIIDAGEAKEGGGAPTASSAGLPETLAGYLGLESTQTGKGEYLTETHGEYVAQLLERFMPRFIKIPAGPYLVGSKHPGPIEQPQRQLPLPTFHLGQFPVSNDLFEIFVRETGYETSAERRGYGHVLEGRLISRVDTRTGRATLIVSNGATVHRVADANWRYPHGPESSSKGKHNHPVVQVSYEDARAFASWAGKRLPTEEEWEAAARGTDDRLFPWGNSWLNTLGNFESSALGDTTPVDRYAAKGASPFGICDLLGNVYEWTASLYYPGHAGAADRQIHILKGGCWSTRSAVTIGHRLIEKGDYWSNIIGFRCAV